MADNNFSQAPTKSDGEERVQSWRDNIQETIFGEEGTGGSLNGDNITNITDPTDADGTLADVTAKVNLLFAELRNVLKIM